jgi:uncharacterized protein
VRRIVLWLVASAALAGCADAHAYPPRPDGPVLDLANVFPAKDEAMLDKRLTDYWRETGNVLVVVSVDSLGGQSIDDFAFGLFDQWGIGDAKSNRGLLVLVAPTERKVRIEVGCGLEGIITDDVAKNIIEADMIPNYKQGDLEAGTLAGVDALIENLKSRAANDSGRHTPACKAKAKEAA